MTDDMLTHEEKIIEYYEQTTDAYYVGMWDDEHINFGLFTPEESHLPIRELRKARARALRRGIEAILRPVRISREHTVVDAGCGVGGTALHVAKHFGCRVIGLNISEHQIKIARSRAEDAGLSDRVQFTFADCSVALPLPGESVDVIVTIESSCHYADRRNFLSECARILKPGGILTTKDWMAADGIPETDYAASIQPVCDAWFFKSLETRSSYTGKLRDAGFEILDFVDFSESALPNTRIMEVFRRQLMFKAMFVSLPKIENLWIQQCGSLCSAWIGGYFRLQHFLARKAH